MTPDELIARVRNEAKAIDVIGRRVSLKPYGIEHVGRCPFHDDQDPSLRVHPTRNVWNCSPCKEGGDAIRFVEKYDSLRFPDAVKKIADELGIDEPIEPPKPQIVATYEYADQAGVVRGVKERWQPAHDGSGKPKSFRWVKRADPWVPTLYKLPEVITGIGEGKPIVVVEGEKCVDALLERGFVATCNEDGAGKWETAHSECLYTADVVVIPDADSAGRAHAKEIEASLAGIAATVSTIDLPGLTKVKGDVFDWFAEGHTTEELAALISRAAWDGKMKAARDALATAGLAPNKWEGPLGENAADLAECEMPAVEWLVQGLLSPAGVHVLAGEPKGGKTWAETEIAICVANGEPVFGEFPVRRRGPVLMICLEDGRRGLRNRLRATVNGKRLDMRRSLVDLRVSSRCSIDLMSNEDCAGIVATARSMPVNPVLICIDPLRDANSGEESSNDDMRVVMHRARAIRDVTGATVLIVHHMSKPENSKGGSPSGSIFNRFRGASAIRGAYDGGIAVETKQKDETNIFSKIEVELREGRGAGVFGLHLNVIDDDQGAARTAGWGFYKDVKVMLGESMEEEESRVERELKGIVAYLRKQHEVETSRGHEPTASSAPPMATALRMSEATLKRRLDDLVKDGAVLRAGRGWIFNSDWIDPKKED